MKQNLAFAFLCNVLGVPLTSGVLYPVLGLLLSLMVGALAMSLSSVSLITNTLWLAKVPLPQSPSNDRRPEPVHGACFH